MLSVLNYFISVNSPIMETDYKNLIKSYRYLYLDVNIIQHQLIKIVFIVHPGDFYLVEFSD